MISPRCKWGKVDQLAERCHQAKQVVPVHINARRSLVLSTDQQSSAR